MRLYNILKNIAADIKALLPSLKVNDASVKETLTPIPITPLVGQVFSNYRCWYYKKGSKVSLLMCLTNLPKNQSSVVFVLPKGYRPYTTLISSATSNHHNYCAAYTISPNGNVTVAPSETAVLFYIEFDAFN